MLNLTKVWRIRFLGRLAENEPTRIYGTFFDAYTAAKEYARIGWLVELC